MRRRAEDRWPEEWFAGPFGADKRLMIERQLAARGIRDPAVLEAMARTPREAFVPDANLAEAYSDRPLPIGFNQTISQPYMVAKTLKEARIKSGDRVLEIGVGCGYQSAVIRGMGAQVFGVEVVPELAAESSARLARLGYEGIAVYCGDGRLGLPGLAPFDAVVTAASQEEMPPALLEQLKVGGRLVGPEGGMENQKLIRYERTPQGLRREELFGVRYVPMTGAGEPPREI